MRKRGDPRQLAKLVAVQHIHRALADVALGVARSAEAEARTREEAAHGAADDARADWLDCLIRPGFAPDYWRALATRVTVREAVAEEAAEATRASAEQHLRRRDDWRAAEARVTSTETRHRLARRDAARGREEARLTEMSDRVTRGWVRP